MDEEEKTLFLKVASLRKEENDLMRGLEYDKDIRARKCPHCSSADMWLPFKRVIDSYFPALIRCHCNQCGCEWNPFWNADIK